MRQSAYKQAILAKNKKSTLVNELAIKLGLITKLPTNMEEKTHYSETIHQSDIKK